MGFKTLELKLRTDYSPEELQNTIKKVLKLQNFTYQIEKQRLDGRNLEDIHWVVMVGVVSPEINNDLEPQEDKFLNTKKKTAKHLNIVGSNPEGFFAAMVAQEAGLKVAVIEQAPEIYQRTKDIKDFEKMDFAIKSVLSTISILFLFVLFSGSNLISQNVPREIRLKYADSLVGSNTPGIAFRDFFGNVQLEHGDVDVRSDFAKQYIELNKADLLGNVVITQKTLVLKSPKIFYDGNTSVSRAEGGVTIKDKETFLKADGGTYNTRTKVAEFVSNIFIEDDSAKIVSDYILHYRNDRKSYAYGNVWIAGKYTNAVLSCDTLVNIPAENYSLAVGKPILIQIDSSFSRPDTLYFGTDSVTVTESKLIYDTLSVTSDTMHTYRELYKERYVFIGNVVIIRGEVRAVADKSIFYKDDEYIMLNGKPIVWYDSTQLYGDSIVIRIPKNELKGIESFSNAIAVSRNDTISVQRLDQIMGDKIFIDIDSGKVKEITSIGEAKSLYFFSDEEGENGVDRRSTDTIKVLFNGGEIENIIWLGMTFAEFFPETYVYGKEDTYYLPLFKWKEKRPVSRKIDFPYKKFAVKH